MTINEMRKKAIQMLVIEKFHCSQALAAVGLEKLGKQNEDIIRSMETFGGGLGCNGEVCGAVAGALAAIGLKYGRAKQGEKENYKMYIYTEELVRRFRDEIAKQDGSILCRDISKVDWKDPDQVKSFYNGERGKACARIVGETAALLGEILER